MQNLAEKLARSFTEKNSQLRELRIIVEACPLATFITNDQGDCIFVNTAYQELVGRSYQELNGDGWKVIIHPDDLPEVAAFWAASLDNEIEFDHQCRYVRPDGDVVPVHCKAVKLPSGGYVGYVNAMDGSNCKFICAARAAYERHREQDRNFAAA